jgi:hypothetical protein
LFIEIWNFKYFVDSYQLFLTSFTGLIWFHYPYNLRHTGPSLVSVTSIPMSFSS